jgi:hypothetical protein
LIKKWLLTIWVLCCVFQSCSEKTPSEPAPTFFDIQGENGFVGSVQGTDAFVSILAGESEAVAYVCNGDEKISEWFKGAVNDPTVINLNNDNGALLSAYFTDGVFQGDIKLSSGITHAFQADPATTAEAGIYRVIDDNTTTAQIDAGWVLLSSGEERGAFRMNSAFQATPALPKTAVPAGQNSFSVFHFRLQPPGPTQPIPIPFPHFPFPTEPEKP